MDKSIYKNPYTEYEDMRQLLKTEDWRVWVNFQKMRCNALQKKVMYSVRNGELVDAQKMVAVIDDIQKQIDLFNKRKVDLENDVTEKGGE